MFTSILRRKTANIELSWPDFYIVLISSHKVNIFILTVRFLKSVGNEYLSNHSIKSAKIPSSCSYIMWTRFYRNVQQIISGKNYHVFLQDDTNIILNWKTLYFIQIDGDCFLFILQSLEFS